MDAASLVVVPARVADTPTVHAILDEARSWLAERGIDQWMRPFAEAWIRDRIVAGELWIARLDGEPAGVVRLLRADQRFWGEHDRGDAVYVHTLAVRRDWRGRGVGQGVVRWAEGQAITGGRQFVRLDCGAANRGLRAYYEQLGFVAVGTVRLGGEVMVLLQKRVHR